MKLLVKKNWLIIVSTLVVFTICALPVQLLINNCFWWECAPERDFTIYDLNIPDKFFPPTATINPLHPDRQDVSVEEAITTNYWENGRAIYSVLRFSTVSKAKKWYHFEMESFSFPEQLENPEKYSEILGYKSIVADDYATICGYIGSNFHCVYGARYQEFYIFFNGSIGDGGMSVMDFIGVLSFIDAKMQKLLY